MEKSSFFNSVNGDRKYKSAEFAEYFSSFIGNGVFPNPSDNLQVIANNDMTITIKQGKAWINGYFYVNTNDLILNIAPADGLLNRKDRIVLRLDFVKREVKVNIKKGDFATNVIVKELQRDADAYELALADIILNKGTISITQSSIVDLRLNKEMCGVVKGTIEEIDTTTLFNQYNLQLSEKVVALDKEFREWFNAIEAQLNGDVAANLAKDMLIVKGSINDLKENLDQELNDNTLTSFKTDVQITPLDGCAGGFISLEKVQGATYNNLSKFVTVATDGSSYYIVPKNEIKSRTVTIINFTGRIIKPQIYKDAAWVSAASVTNIKTTIVLKDGEDIRSIYASFNDGWTEANKNELLKIMVLDGEVKNPPTSYFEGMKSVGQLVMGNNLIDTSKIIVGGLTWATGVYDNQHVTSGNCYDVFISVIEGEIIYRNIKCLIFLYDSTKNYLGVERVGHKAYIETSLMHFLVPTGVAYVKIGFYGENSSTLLNTKLSYGSYKVEILSQGKNLFDIDNSKTFINGDYKINSNTIRAYSNASFSAGSSYYIALEPNKSYIFKCNINIGGNASGNYTLIRNSNHVDIAILRDTSSYVKFTSPINGIIYIMFCRIGGANDKNGWIDFSNISLIDESLDQTYEPYKCDRTEILLPRELDEFSSIDSDGVATWGSAEIVLNKETQVNYIKRDVNCTLFSIPLTTKGKVLYPKCKTTLPFPYRCAWDANDEHYYVSDTGWSISIANSRLATPDGAGLKKWIEENNFKLLYQVLNPIIENTNKTLNFRGYDNLIVNSGAVQGEVTYSYAKNTGGRLNSIEDTIEVVKDRVESSINEISKIIENGDLKKEVDKAKEDIANLERGLLTVTGDVLSNTDTVKSLNTTVTNQGKTITTLQTTVNNQASTISFLQSKIDDLTKVNSTTIKNDTTIGGTTDCTKIGKVVTIAIYAKPDDSFKQGTICTLPQQFRPLNTIDSTIQTIGCGIQTIRIDTTGVIEIPAWSPATTKPMLSMIGAYTYISKE